MYECEGACHPLSATQSIPILSTCLHSRAICMSTALDNDPGVWSSSSSERLRHDRTSINTSHTKQHMAQLDPPHFTLSLMVPSAFRLFPLVSRQPNVVTLASAVFFHQLQQNTPHLPTLCSLCSPPFRSSIVLSRGVRLFFKCLRLTIIETLPPSASQKAYRQHSLPKGSGCFNGRHARLYRSWPQPSGDPRDHRHGRTPYPHQQKDVLH